MASAGASSGVTAGDGGEGYRPDIDGLRAVAIGAVIAFHAAPGQLPGGFVGVDIFFVISGYLISGIILRRLDRGTFSFRDFYARRIRRIFPALLLVLACSAAAAWLLVYDLDRFGRHMTGSAAFAANLVLAREISYFNYYAYLDPLLHLWSLGVEEQFYFAWPFLLWLGARRRAALPWLIAALGAASFLLNLHYTAVDPTIAFYSPFTRFWELLAGAWLAAMARSPRNPRLAHAASFAGLAAMAAPMFLIGEVTAFPGWWALLPVGGAFLTIWAGPAAWPNARLLAWRPAVWIGLISYPLYLWHWPLLAFAAHYNLEGRVDGVWRAAIVLFAILPAWATYVWLEKPVRERRMLGVASLSVTMAAMFVLGAAFWAGGAQVERGVRQDPRRSFLARNRDFLKNGVGPAYRSECDFNDWSRRAAREAIAEACTAPGARATWFLWGDSHAQALSFGLRKNLPAGTALAQVASGACAPGVEQAGATGRIGLACRRSNAFALRRIAEIKPDLVILAQRQQHERTDWAALAGELKRRGARRIVLIGPAPQWTLPLPHLIAKDHWPEVPLAIKRRLTPAMFVTDAILRRRYGDHPALSYVSLTAALCNEQGCRARGASPQEPMAIDYGHLSPSGSQHVARAILLPRLGAAVADAGQGD